MDPLNPQSPVDYPTPQNPKGTKSPLQMALYWINQAACACIRTVEHIARGYAVLTSERVGQWQRLPKPLRNLINKLHVFVGEVLGAIFLGVVFPINLERLDPTKKEVRKDTPPILLIHGFLGSSNNWIYQRKELERAGHTNVFTVNLGDPRKSIAEFAERVRDKVDTIKELTGRDDVILVGHSMGGLVARKYRYEHAESQGVNVRKIITLGTPLAGTKTASIAAGLSKAAAEMRSDSPFVTNLQNCAQKDEHTNYVHVATKIDEIIRPVTSALEGHGKKITRIEKLKATGHIAYLFSQRVADILREEIENVSITV